MATFYTRPEITLRRTEQPDILSRFIQLQQLADDRRFNTLREREALLRLKELERQAIEAEARRQAFAAGAQPGFEPSTGRMPEVPGLEGLGASPMAPREPRTPQSAILAKLQELSPHQVPELEAQFGAQAVARQKQSVEFDDAIANLDKTQLENAGKRVDMIARMAQSVLDNPENYPSVRIAAIQQGLIRADDPNWPEQYSPELRPRLQSIVMQSKEMTEALAKKQHDLAMEVPESERSFQAWLKSPPSEREARKEFAQQKKELIPGRDIPYPPDVEAQRLRENALRAQRDGLSPQQFTKVQSLASSFDTNPTVKQFNETVNRAANVERILAGPWTGPGDMAMIFEFMRSLDPTSVVRESEYATAARTGNIFAGWAARFNGVLRPEGGFLSEQVKKDFSRVLRGKIETSRLQVKRMHGDFARRINKITGREDGPEYLTDYSELFKGIEGGEPAAPAGPKIGETRQHQGATYKFDGTQWVKQ